MRLSIFNVKKEKIVLNTNVLLIKPFNDLYNVRNGEKLLAYCFYMTNPYPDENPFIYIDDKIKSSKILQYIGISSLPEEHKPLINECIRIMNEMYETPLVRLNKAIKMKIDDISSLLSKIDVTEKNLKMILEIIKGYKDVSEPYKMSVKNIMEEREMNVVGKNMVAYDQ